MLEITKMTFEIIVGAGQPFDLITVKQAWPVALTHGIEMPGELVEQRWQLTLLVKHIEITAQMPSDLLCTQVALTIGGENIGNLT
jgi:hypothetical protein